MQSEQTLLEEFFETTFIPAFDVPHVIVEANIFDGFVFWRIWWDESNKWLYFSADTQEHHPAFPILEASIYYSELRTGELTGGGSERILLVTAQVLPSNFPFTVTKTSQGRFSLAVAAVNPTDR